MEDKETEVFEYCDKCEREIYANQKVWKAGNELFCDLGCLINGLKVDYVTITTKRK
ncbi:hypothetical protein [Brevibacillus laterosporus]|uniref:hypothetical protein n=1 Tax=Brevibacillus laterosporus TaxID=1465 RepID=UPI0018F8A46D|nr:hypothetical protein [Brevibacillus laterosporus]